MKYSKLFAVMAVVSTLLFTDCSKTADPVAPSLVGTWKASSTSKASCSISSSNTPDIPCGASTCEIATFTSSTITITSQGSSLSGTYTTSGTTLTASLTINGSGLPFTLVYTYTLTATTLTLTYYDGTALCNYITKYAKQ